MASIGVDDIRRAISLGHPDREWLVIDEFPLEGGRRNKGTPRIDLLAVKTSVWGRHELMTREAYEIKVSREDFLRELRYPEKRLRAYEVCDYYWFAVPDGLVKKDEVPPECGLLWVGRGFSGGCLMKMPKKLDSKSPTSPFIADLARRAHQIGRRDGAGTCAFERFDLLMEMAYMFMKGCATTRARRELLLTIARAIAGMQRPREARALREIANGGPPASLWHVARNLQTGRFGTGDPAATPARRPGKSRSAAASRC